MKIEPVAFIWSGREMVPLDRFRKLAERQYRAGTEYVLVDHKGRSEESHRHYFACIRAGWQNLPEDQADKYPSPEYLRKKCLVLEGYADQTDHVCEDDEAMAKMITLIRKLDPYSVMTRSGNVLTIFTAQSQDHASMGHEAFQTSKTRVLERIASMCGISLEELTKNAKETT
jgi:hypothetical protein